MKVIGWKAWFADGSLHVGTTRRDWEALPEDGLLIVMLYYDEFTQGIPDQRYRRIVQGSDLYFVTDGPADLIFGQATDPETSASILARYPGASVKRGRWTDDHTHAQIAAEAMADHDYSPFE